jgi:hypothetical protein
MIKECYMAKTGIRFDHDYLSELDFDMLELAHYLEDHGLDVLELGFNIEHLTALADEAKEHHPQNGTPTTPVRQPSNIIARSALAPSVLASLPRSFNVLLRARARADALARIWDQLILAKVWWGLEALPMLATYQKENGTWIRRRM